MTATAEYTVSRLEISAAQHQQVIEDMERVAGEVFGTWFTKHLSMTPDRLGHVELVWRVSVPGWTLGTADGCERRISVTVWGVTVRGDETECGECTGTGRVATETSRQLLPFLDTHRRSLAWQRAARASGVTGRPCAAERLPCGVQTWADGGAR